MLGGGGGGVCGVVSGGVHERAFGGVTGVEDSAPEFGNATANFRGVTLNEAAGSAAVSVLRESVGDGFHEGEYGRGEEAGDFAE